MPDLEIIAEAAQGYEGDAGIARLLVRAAAASGADAIKFQIVFADDLAAPGYRYYDLFRQLEMPDDSWREIRSLAKSLGLRFYGDIFGPRSAELSKTLDMDGVKISTTCFYDDVITAFALEMFPRVFLSIGGIPFEDAFDFFERHRTAKRSGVTVLFGYQAEPTLPELNNLNRIVSLRKRLGVQIGFMDHADGAGGDEIALSAMALALGVTVFEKHITLNRSLELEDFVSALAPAEFATYCETLRRLAPALGDASLELIADERTYRDKACKRVVAARDLKVGRTLSADDILLLRPAVDGGFFRPEEAVGRTLTADVARHAPIDERVL